MSEYSAIIYPYWTTVDVSIQTTFKFTNSAAICAAICAAHNAAHDDPNEAAIVTTKYTAVDVSF